MRTRLSTEQRREQLIGIGAKLFAERPYEDVWIEEVAEIAGVSRGLLYHYFPGKRAFYAEILRSTSEKLAAMAEPDPSLPLIDQLNAGLDVYLDFAEQHPHAYRFVHRSAGELGEDIAQLRRAGIDANRDQILAGIRTVTEVDARIELAVNGWMEFVIAVVLGWLDDPGVSREDAREILVRALFAAVGLSQ